MKKQEITEVVIGVLDGMLDLSEYPLEASFNGEFGMDSLDEVEFVIELERRLNISIPDSIVDRMNTINATVEELLKIMPNEI